MTTIDLTNINRFKDKSKPFVNKILHSEEIILYEKSNNKAKFLAKRWAIKEAIFKNDNKYYLFNNILINNDDKKYTFKNFNISITSEDNYIIALVEKE